MQYARRGWRLGWLLMAVVLAVGTARAEQCSQPTPISIGIVPWLSGPSISVWSRSLVKHLRQRVCVDARFASDAGIRAHYLSAREGRYDLLLEPTHMGLLLVHRHGFEVVGYMALSPTPVGLVVRGDSGLQRLEDLRGKVVALPDPLTLASLAAERKLRLAGVQVRRVQVARHDQALGELVARRADAAAVIIQTLPTVQAPPGGFRVLTELLPADVASVTVVIRPGVAAALRQRLEEGLRSFDGGDHALMPRMEALNPAQIKATAAAIAPYEAELLAALTAADRSTN